MDEGQVRGGEGGEEGGGEKGREAGGGEVMTGSGRQGDAPKAHFMTEFVLGSGGRGGEAELNLAIRGRVECENSQILGSNQVIIRVFREEGGGAGVKERLLLLLSGRKEICD